MVKDQAMVFGFVELDVRIYIVFPIFIAVLFLEVGVGRKVNLDHDSDTTPQLRCFP